MTTAVALTTTFTPASSCLSTFFRAAGWDQLGPSPSATECFPSGWNDQTSFAFSPGICPSGYTSASVGTNTFQSAAETIVQCCPNSYRWTSAYSGFSLTTSSVCFSWYDDRPGSAVYTIPDYLGTVVLSSRVKTLTSRIGEAMATPVQIRFQGQDYLPSTSRSSASASSRSASSNSGSASTSTSTPTLPGSTATTGTTAAATETATAVAPGLSTGAKVGIGIGSTAGAVVLLALLIWAIVLSRRNRQRRSQGDYQGTYDVNGQGDHGQVYAGEDNVAVATTSVNAIPVEKDGGIDGTPRSELDSKTAGRSVCCNSIYELEGSTK